MARERMTKLLKYGHFEAITCHINNMKNPMFIRKLQSLARSHPWPSHENLAYTMASAASRCTGKNYLSQIEY